MAPVSFPVCDDIVERKDQRVLGDSYKELREPLGFFARGEADLRECKNPPSQHKYACALRADFFTLNLLEG
ncbi:hypothetical protein A3A39_00570 [Candidatus Kaiserbacteria bacterium RIFCSPLOWO2_01_FULL_54_13]|uniref:Uncharacterized protein n=1 Tax=Candidatus Kaiserbacteria bacterium RIFCSPLOWO2_01_FULL_54_13 TaxID=1798512 RepID=A0A1F6F0J8_9BACT|nr:MAG: hypothetical protein A3A39_00570 [Candidatus Kaiserbacteria bacterium RIFCSPLOWO2_01_FULL_54_13]